MKFRIVSVYSPRLGPEILKLGKTVLISFDPGAALYALSKLPFFGTKAAEFYVE